MVGGSGFSMAQARTGLLRQDGKYAEKPFRINDMRQELVFREADD
jgi:hypothetical protein